MSPGPRAGPLPSLWLFGPAVLWLVAAAVGLWNTARAESKWSPVVRRFGDTAGSDDCRRCHPQQWRSWHQTFHRTMTQRVDAPDAIVLAPFGGEQLRYAGFVATMGRDDRGRPHVRIAPEQGGPTILDASVELTVGTHRYQQYVARIDRGGGALERWRLPVAWHREAGRWIHLNGAFLEPEAAPGDADGYARHLSRWNDNCIFCHNTEPVPGLEPDTTVYDTRVGEVGIACEACHGPGAAHVRRHLDPFRRLLARGDGDPSVTHPERLSPARAAEVCGRCHGQRIGHDIARILADGDGFVPGASLADVSRPIFADSEVAGLGPEPFAARFWPDGTPRLSAYEYQGLVTSPCFGGDAGLTCNDCHDMHDADPDGQVPTDRRGDGACVDCHAPAERSAGHAAHAVVQREGGDQVEVTCLDCHMPRTTYGLLEGLRSHRITTPDPGAWLGRDDMPDACTQCHVTRSRAWAAAGMAQLGFRSPSTAGHPTSRESWASRVALDLLGGDALQRALAARALAEGPGAVGSTAFRAAWLAEALDDPYPGVRFIAWRALEATLAARGEDGEDALGTLSRFDPFAPLERRIALTAEVRARLPGDPRPGEVLPATLGDARRAALESEADATPIWIGE